MGCYRGTRKIVEWRLAKRKVHHSCREWDSGAAQAALSILPVSFLLPEESQRLPWGGVLPQPGDEERR